MIRRVWQVVAFVVSVFAVAFATYLAYETVHFEGPGLRRVGHYALVTPEAAARGLRIGSSDRADIVLAGVSAFHEAAQLRLVEGAWMMTPAAEAGTVESGAGARPHEQRLEPGRYRFARDGQEAIVTLDAAGRSVVSEGRQTRTLTGIGGARLAIASLGVALICREGPGDSIRVFARLTNIDRITPLTIYRADDGEVAGTLAPLIVHDGDRVQVGDAGFQLEIARVERLHLVSLRRVPRARGGFWPIVRSTASPILFNPYAIWQVSPCGQAGAGVPLRLRQPVQIPRTPGRPMPRADFIGASGIDVQRPLWLTRTPEDLVICSDRGGARLARVSAPAALNASAAPDPAAPAATAIAPAAAGGMPVDIDAWRGAGESQKRGPADWPPIAAPGTVFLFGGQEFQVIGGTRPAEIQRLQVLPVVALWAAALPLLGLFAVVLGEGFRRAASSGLDPVKRLIHSIPTGMPLLALFLIMVVMSTAVWFHLRLAASSRLANHAHYLNTFIDANLAALVIATAASGWYLAGTLPALRLASLSALLGTSLLFWVDAWLVRRAGTSIYQTIPPLPAPTWPLLLPIGAALALLVSLAPYWWPNVRWPDRLEGPVKKTGDYLVKKMIEGRDWWYDRLIGDPEARVKKTASAGRRLVASARALALAVVFVGSVLVVPILGAALVATQVAEAVPLVTALLGVWLLARVVHFSLTEVDGDEQGSLRGNLIVVLGGLLTLGVAIFLSFFLVRYVYDIRVLAVMGTIYFGTTLWIFAAAEAFQPAALFWRVLACFGVLFGGGLLIGDLGAVLIWAPAISFVAMYALVVEGVLPSLEAFSRRRLAAHFFVAAMVATLPVFMLGVFPRAIELDFLPRAWLERPRIRFALVDTPFYHDAGDWLGQVRYLTADLFTSEHWISNLNSDVAAFGMRDLFPSGFVLLALATPLLLLVLTVAFIESYRRAATRRSGSGQSMAMAVSLTLALTIFGLTMQVLVHLSAGAFDQLPLTGVPFPWISHANLTHVTLLLLVLIPLVRLAEAAPEEVRS